MEYTGRMRFWWMMIGGLVLAVAVISVCLTKMSRDRFVITEKMPQPNASASKFRPTNTVKPTAKPSPVVLPTKNPPKTRSQTTVVIRGNKQLTGLFASESQRPSGKLLWKFKPGNRAVTDTPLISKGIAYFHSGEKKIYATDARSGKPLWTLDLAYPILTPMFVDGNQLFAADYKGTVNAIDINTQKIVWKFQVDNAKGEKEGTGTGMVMTAITGENGLIYFSDSNGKLYALDSQTGNLKWKFETQLSFKIPMVSIFDGVVYATNNEGFLHALDAKTGSEKWRFSTGKRQTLTSAIIADNKAYFISGDNYLRAIDINSHQQVWAYKLKTGATSSIGVLLQEPAATGGKIFVSGRQDEIMEIVKSNGQSDSIFTAGEWIEAAPTIANGVLYLGSYHRAQGNLGYLYAIEMQTNKVLWKFKTDGPGIVSPPIIADGVVYFVDMGGTLYAIE